jgi:hypothetical protein
VLKSGGPILDPQQLFRSHDGKTRISVINLAGLGSDAAQQSFVNQLQMAPFIWIKQNPIPTGRLGTELCPVRFRRRARHGT